MRLTLLAATFLTVLSAQPASAEKGGGFAAGVLGGLVGGAVAGALVPRAPVYAPPPAPVYVAPPPVYYQPHVYVAPPPPVYVPPAARVSFHPWPGPGFACYEPEPNSVNRAICGSEDLSAASLAVQQAFYAAIQQTPYNAGSLRAEYNNFLQSERVSCVQYSYQQQSDCISGMLAHEHDMIMSRLNGVYAEEAARPVGLHVEVQQRLRSIGLLASAADGIYGDSTRRAIAAWQSGQRHAATGVMSNDEVAMLIPGYGAPSAPMQVYVPPATPAPAPAASPPPVQLAVSQPAVQAAPPPAPPAAATPAAVTDVVGGMREGMPYALARTKLFNAGWQTQYFNNASLSDQDRESRQWFIDHRFTEVQDCSTSGCKLQFHNADGRLLYVYTQLGSHASDAFRGAGPSVIAYCVDVDDIACASPQAVTGSATQQAIK